MQVDALPELGHLLHALQSLSGMRAVAGEQLGLQVLAGRHFVRRRGAHEPLVHVVHRVGVLLLQDGVGLLEVLLQLRHAFLPQLVVLDQLLVHLALHVGRTDGVSASLDVNGHRRGV